MRTIQILITVPDGVDVKIGGTAQQQSSRPFVERPDPPRPNGACPEHGVDWRLVPGGVSKKAVNEDGTPKRYNSFWACPERGCNEKPGREMVIEDVSGSLPF